MEPVRTQENWLYVLLAAYSSYEQDTFFTINWYFQVACITVISSMVSLHLLCPVTCLLFCQQISCENPELISDISRLFYFWTKGE